MARNMIHHLGHEVIEPADGREAVAVFRGRVSEIGCVVRDLFIPGMEGWKTIEAVRGICPGIPVIRLASMTRPNTLIRVRANRRIPSLTSPINWPV